MVVTVPAVVVPEEADPAVAVELAVVPTEGLANVVWLPNENRELVVPKLPEEGEGDAAGAGAATGVEETVLTTEVGVLETDEEAL